MNRIISIPEIETADIPSMEQEIIKGMLEKKEQLYVEILRQILGREPTVEDGKGLTAVNYESCPIRN